VGAAFTNTSLWLSVMPPALTRVFVFINRAPLNGGIAAGL
jgi:hypothetical protein